jgi:hypothetical protein
VHFLPRTTTELIVTLLAAGYFGYVWGHRIGKIGGWSAHCRAWGWTGWASYFIVWTAYFALFCVVSLLSPFN